ncbi:MAG: lipid-A-disaccharide synthase N-terminal domain-containing protein [Bacteroidota bacterium]
MKIIGTIGLIAIAACWIPQTIETVRAKRTDVKLSFLLLYLVGSLSLTVYALLIHDVIFIVLNSIATIESGVNLYYKAFPRAFL